jgi:AbrB family looped-hinge helix DNA binding protein
MTHLVGTKGQVVIAKEIRAQLGIHPGWLAVQRVVGDHVEIRFLPPEHERSLAGILREKCGSFDGDEEAAWPEAARREWLDE